MSEVRVILSPNLSEAEVRALQGAVVLDPDTWDVGIIGVYSNEQDEIVAVYDESVLIELIMNELLEAQDAPDEEAENQAYDDAADYLNHNTVRALPYMGQRAPVLVSELFDETDEEEVGEDREILEMGGKRWLVSL